MLVAMMMEGKSSGEGLQALDTDEDLLSAMARELGEKPGVGESADAVWKELGGEREKVLPRPPEQNLEPREDTVTVLEDSDHSPSAPTTFGVPLLEPGLAPKTSKKAAFWPTAKESTVQLSLFD